MKKEDLKVGEKYVIVAKDSNHKFNIGEEVECFEIESDHIYDAKMRNSSDWWFVKASDVLPKTAKKGRPFMTEDQKQKAADKRFKSKLLSLQKSIEELGKHIEEINKRVDEMQANKAIEEMFQPEEDPSYVSYKQLFENLLEKTLEPSDAKKKEA